MEVLQEDHNKMNFLDFHLEDQESENVVRQSQGIRDLSKICKKAKRRLTVKSKANGKRAKTGDLFDQ